MPISFTVEAERPQRAAPGDGSGTTGARVSKQRAAVDVVLCPFVVIVDTREQAPWGFDNLTDGADRKPLVVRTERQTLASGDYSIEGLSDQISIERKSKEDLYGTLTGGRDRFERELERLQAMPFSMVIVESSLHEVCHNPPVGSRVLPKSIFRSVVALEQRFPKTHWRFCDRRRFAEVYAFRALERFWKDREAESVKGGK